jgi:hypothetical protein
MNDRHTKALTKWALKWKDEYLSTEVRILIGQAITDLYEGTLFDETYPGFTTACNTIKQALLDLPSNLYIDLDTDDVSETEPQAEECEGCKEDNTTVFDHDCLVCGNTGSVDPGGEWYHVERAEIKAAVVGKQLSGYV